MARRAGAGDTPPGLERMRRVSEALKGSAEQRAKLRGRTPER
jgi:hypothetical protein